MPNTLLDLLVQGTPLEVTGIANLEPTIREVIKSRIGKVNGTILKEVAREVGDLVEATTVLFTALQMASGSGDEVAGHVQAARDLLNDGSE